jgi:PadR family transcriptional regulator AphA
MVAAMDDSSVQQRPVVSPAGCLILGLILQGRRSGYEIKTAVDRGARFFWALSFGQVYPELRRLEAGGLIEGEASPEGGRRRRLFRLTEAGRSALDEWLALPPLVLEVRNEGLLKLFFADALEPAEVLGLVRGQRRLQEQRLEALKPKLPVVRASCAAGGVRFPLEVLEYGIAQARWALDWWVALEARLEAAATASVAGPVRKVAARRQGSTA